MVKTAVILAAGLGSRLGERTESSPKGFLEIDGIGLVEASVEKLLSVGIERIVIGTGYLSEFYEALSERYSEIECVRNVDFSDTGSMATLRGLEGIVEDGFLLLESDLVYERRVLLAALDAPQDTVVLGSVPLDQGDDVFIEVDAQDRMVSTSKDASQLSSWDSVLVGVSKVSYDVFLKMCRVYDDVQNSDLHYEDVMVLMADFDPLYVLPIGDLVWSEIDTEGHLAFVLDRIMPEIRRRDGLPVLPRPVLLNPGPATTSSRVKQGLIVPDICPREATFGGVMGWVSETLVDLVGDRSREVGILITGPGTAAVEAMIASVIGDSDRLLVIENGAYGKRMREIAEVYGLNITSFLSDEISSVDLKALELRLVSGQITHLAVVHHETSTGLLVDLPGIVALCQKLSVSVLVDAMSSFGAVAIEMDGIDFLAASANKNLQGMPGISFVIANREALERSRSVVPRNYSLNLIREYDCFKASSQVRFTPAVQTVYALREALWELKREGLEDRYRRYMSNWEVLMAGLKELGFRTFVDEACHSKLITAIEMPEGFDFEQCHDYLFRRGFTIYPGKIASLNSFRIATIGDLNVEDIRAFLGVLSEFMSRG